jgi:hypothetical protein
VEIAELNWHHAASFCWSFPMVLISARAASAFALFKEPMPATESEGEDGPPFSAARMNSPASEGRLAARKQISVTVNAHARATGLVYAIFFWISRDRTALLAVVFIN